MNKLIKTCIIGSIIYAISDASYQIGKGHMLGALAKTDLTGSQGMDAISDDKHPRVKFVSMVAKLTKEEL